MDGIISIAILVLGNILMKQGTKKETKLCKNIGVIMIILCSTYILLSAMHGFTTGFIAGLTEPL